MDTFYKGCSNLVNIDGEDVILDIFIRNVNGARLTGIDWMIASRYGITKSNLKRIILPYSESSYTQSVAPEMIDEVPNLESITIYNQTLFEKGSLDKVSIKYFITNGKHFVFYDGYEPVQTGDNVLYLGEGAKVEEEGEYYLYFSGRTTTPVKFKKSSWTLKEAEKHVFTYEETSKGVFVTGVNRVSLPSGAPEGDGRFVFPKEVQGKEVTGISEGAFENYSFKVESPSGQIIKTFPNLADADSSLRYIGARAFKGATLSTYGGTVYLPKSLENLGEEAFDTANAVVIILREDMLEIGKDFYYPNFKGAFLKGSEISRKHIVTPPSYAFGRWYKVGGGKVVGFYPEVLKMFKGETVNHANFMGVNAFGGIDQDAFKGLPLVNLVAIPGTSIGDRAFKDTNVENVYFSREEDWMVPQERDKGVRIGGQYINVGEEAFMNTQVKEVHDSGAGPFYRVNKRCFYNTPLHTFGYKTTHTVFEEAFAKTKLKNFAFPGRVKEIGRRAFAETELETFSFSSDIKEIPEEAFRGSKLKELHIPSNIEKIGDKAFHDNPGGIITVDKLLPGDEAVLGEPPKLRGYQFPKGWKFHADIFEYYFESDKEVVISGIKYDVVEEIWGGMPEILSIPETLDGNKVVGIGDSRGLFNLNYLEIKEVRLPEGLRYIGAELFKYNLLKEVTIPSTVETIDKSAFETNLIEKVNIKPGVHTIKERAFYENKISELKLPEGIKVLYGDSFSNNELTHIQVADSLETIRAASNRERNPFRDNPGGIIEFNPTEDDVIPEDGVGPTLRGVKLDDVWKVITSKLIFEDYKDGLKVVGLEMFLGGGITIPDYEDGKKVIRIEDDAFLNEEITKVSIGNNVEEIGKRAFKGNSLTSLIIPLNVREIGSEAFYGNKIKAIDIHHRINSIGKWGLSVQEDGEEKGVLAVYINEGDFVDGNGNLHLRGDVFYKEEWNAVIKNLPKCDKGEGQLRTFEFINLRPEFPNKLSKGIRSFTIIGKGAEEEAAPVEVFEEGYTRNLVGVKNNWKIGTVAESRAEGTSWEGLYLAYSNRVVMNNTVNVDGRFTTSVFNKDYEYLIVLLDSNNNYLGREKGFYGWSSNDRTISHKGRVGIAVRKKDNSDLKIADVIKAKVKLSLGNLTGKYTLAWEDIPKKDLRATVSGNLAYLIEPIDEDKTRVRIKGGDWDVKMAFLEPEVWKGWASSEVYIANNSPKTSVHYSSYYLGTETVKPGESKKVSLSKRSEPEEIFTVEFKTDNPDDILDIVVGEPYLAMGEYVPGSIKKEVVEGPSDKKRLKITVEGNKGQPSILDTPVKDLVTNLGNEEYLEAKFKAEIEGEDIIVTDSTDGSGEHVYVPRGQQEVKYPMAKDSDIIVFEKTGDNKVQIKVRSLDVSKNKYSPETVTKYKVLKPSNYEEVKWNTLNSVREKIKDKGVKLISKGEGLKGKYEIRIPNTGPGKTFSSYIKNMSHTSLRIGNGKESIEIGPDEESVYSLGGSEKGIVLESESPIKILVHKSYVSEGALPVPYILESENSGVTETEVLGAVPGNVVGFKDSKVRRGNRYTTLTTVKNEGAPISVETVGNKTSVKSKEEITTESTGDMKDDYIIKVGVTNE